MTIEEMIHENLATADARQMKKLARTVSDYVEEYGEEKQKSCLKRQIYGIVGGGHYNREYAEEDISNMCYQDVNGIMHHGPFYTEEETAAAFSRHKDDVSDYCLWDFAVVMNMMRSDYDHTLTRLAKDEEHLDEIVEMLSVEYLQDTDAPHPHDKVWKYING